MRSARLSAWRAAAVLAGLITGSCCGADRPELACSRGGANCKLWVVVLQSQDSVPVARAWIAQQGWLLERQIDALGLFYLRLPKGDAGAAAVALLKVQPWVRYVSDQATAVPDQGS